MTSRKNWHSLTPPPLCHAIPIHYFKKNCMACHACLDPLPERDVIYGRALTPDMSTHQNICID